MSGLSFWMTAKTWMSAPRSVSDEPSSGHGARVSLKAASRYHGCHMIIKHITASDRHLFSSFLALSCLLSVTSAIFAGQDDPTYKKPAVTDDDSDSSSADEGSDVVLQQDQSGTIAGFGGEWSGMRHLERIQFLSNITTLRNSPTFLPLTTEPVALELWTPRPAPLVRSNIEPLLGSPLEPVMTPIRNIESWLGSNYGMNFGIYYTMLYQHVSDPVPGGARDIGTGRLDFNMVWNLWESPGVGHSGSGHDGHGLFGILVRQGNQIGVANDVTTTGSVGSTQGLDSLYTGQFGGSATLNLFYYQQGFDDDRLVLSVGKLHPNQYIGLNFWANDESRQFLAGPFDGLQTIGDSHGSYQLGVAMQWVPNESFFVNAMVTDALGTPNNTFSTLDEGYVWSAVEVGWVLPFDEEALGGPTVLSAIWAGQNLDDINGGAQRQWSNGFALQLQGHLSENVGVWAQGGLAESTMSRTTAGFSVGLGIENPFGDTSRGDLFGVAFNWSKPSDRLAVPLEEQSMLEMFYRIQLTGSCQLTPDLQVVFDPGARADSATSFVLGLRLTTDF